MTTNTTKRILLAEKYASRHSKHIHKVIYPKIIAETEIFDPVITIIEEIS